MSLGTSTGNFVMMMMWSLVSPNVGRVDVQARVVYVSECVCLLYPSIFIFYCSFCFWLMIFLWFLVVFVLEMRTIFVLFLLLFVSLFFFFFLYAPVFYVYCRVIPDVLHWCTFMYPHWGF